MKKIKDLEPVQASEGTGQEITPKKRGRPPGAKNKNTIFKELMQDEFRTLATTEVPKVLGVLFEKAKEGDISAIKMVMDRIVPVHKATDSEALSKSGGLTVNVTIGDLEGPVQASGEVIEDAEYTVVED